MSRDGCIETWSKELVEGMALPHALQDCLAREYGAFPYCILAPATSGTFGAMPETCLCLGDTKLGIFRLGAQEWSPILVDLHNCDYLELGKNLLLSWIVVSFLGKRHVVWFNTASEELYKPFMEAFRLAREEDAERTGDLDSFLAPMIKTDYRFFTYPRSAFAGRVPEASFYHPLARIRGGFLRRKAIGSYYLALANGLLYTFSEEHAIRSLKTADYSLVIRYVPVDAGDTGFTCKMTEDGFSLVTLMIRGECVLGFPVADSNWLLFRDFSSQAHIRIIGGGHEAIPGTQY